MIFIRYLIHSLATVTNLPASSENSLKHFERVTKTYFSGESLLFIYWNNNSAEFRLRLLDYWVTSKIVTVETCNCDHVTDDIIWERSFVKNTVVLFGDMIPEQRDIERMRQCLSWNARSKVLAIANDSENIVNILEKIWTFTKAINVTVMVLTTSSVRYYTSYPYQKFKIVELEPDELFPMKPLDNLQGSVVVVAATHSEPYVFVPVKPDVYTEGLEIRMMNLLSERYNFKMKFIKPQNGESPWVLMSPDNTKIAGNFKLLDRCEADLLFHGVQIRFDRCSFADVTAVHTFDSLVWVVPLNVFSFGWKSVFIIFSNELWMALILTLIMFSTMIYLITKYEFESNLRVYRPSDAFFQIVAIFLSVPIHFYRKGQLYRLFIFGVSYYILIIDAVYQSSLISHLTTPGSGRQYQTINDAVDDGLIGYLFLSGKSTYNVTNHELWNKILSPGRFVYSDDSSNILRMIAYNKTIYSQLMKKVVDFEVNKNLLDSEQKPMVHVLPKTVLPYMASIFTSKGHPLTDLIKKRILRLFETGIISHWMRDILLKNFKIQRGVMSTAQKGPVALSIEHLRGAFYIIPFFGTISLAIFICEVVCKLWSNKKKSCKEN